LSGGKSSVLYKKLVDEQKQALQVAAVNIPQMDYNIFALFALPLGEVSLETLLAEMDEEIAKMQDQAQEKLAEIAKASEAKLGTDVNSMVSRGKVYQEIVEVSEMVGADYIVMGTQGVPKTMKKIMGSNANRVIRMSKVPVITIKGQNHKELKTIVLPLDLKKETKEKVSNAIEFARLFGAEVKLVSVIRENLDSDAIQELKLNMKQVYKFIHSHNIKVDSDILYRDKDAEISNEILTYAKEKDADLIMIMTQQENDFTLHFLGSAAQNIIHNSFTPVMSVRPTVTQFSYELP
ncbi:MAG: universal stress protein, partial [Flavobacteriales bacterium]